MQSTVELVLEHARRANAARVHLVRLRIGELSGVSPDALSFAFDVVTKDTIAEGAKFETVETPARYRCRACDSEFEPRSVFWTCPTCCGDDVILVAGRELELASLEVT